MSFILNQRVVQPGERPGMVLLDYIRGVACLSGTKEACREGECGACTVLVGRRQADGSMVYKACASCILPVGDVEGCHVVTVEGLSGKQLTLVQQLIVDNNASQCGFCTPGIVMSLTGFCLNSADFSYDEAVNALDGNICRCTGYVAIRNAARALCDRLANVDKSPAKRTATLIAAGVLPDFFTGISERLAQLESAPATAAEGAVLVAGGTDLFVQRSDQLFDAEELEFLSQRRELDYVRVENGMLRVGGAVVIEDFRLSEPVRQHFPALVQDLLLHSSTILRNKATLTGNLVNASPIGDVSIILLALDARATIVNRQGERRETRLDEFFRAYKKTDLHCGEVITELAIPLLPEGARYHFEKVSNRTTLDIAAVNSAIRITTSADGAITDLRISAGGVGPTPLLVGGLEQFHGRKVDAATVDAIVQASTDAAKPIDDIRGSASYKKLLVGQLVRAHFSALNEVTR